MKTLFIMLFVGILVQAGYASNFPPSVYNISVTSRHQGPLLFVTGGNMTSSYLIIGYKKYGKAALMNPPHLSAEVTVVCTDDSTAFSYSKTATVEIGREWNNTGYMTYPLQLFSYIPRDCFYNRNFTIRVGDESFSFASNGSDPRNTFETHSTPESGGLNSRAWEFIVNEMRK